MMRMTTAQSFGVAVTAVVVQTTWASLAIVNGQTWPWLVGIVLTTMAALSAIWAFDRKNRRFIQIVNEREQRQNRDDAEQLAARIRALTDRVRS